MADNAKMTTLTEDEERPRADTDCGCDAGGEGCPCDADGPDGLCSCCRTGHHRGACASLGLEPGDCRD